MTVTLPFLSHTCGYSGQVFVVILILCVYDVCGVEVGPSRGIGYALKNPLIAKNKEDHGFAMNAMLHVNHGLSTVNHEEYNILHIQQPEHKHIRLHKFHVRSESILQQSMKGFPPEIYSHVSPLNKVLTMQCGDAYYKPFPSVSNLDDMFQSGQAVIMSNVDPLSTNKETAQTQSQIVVETLLQYNTPLNQLNKPVYTTDKGNSQYTMNETDYTIVVQQKENDKSKIDKSCKWHILQDSIFQVQYISKNAPIDKSKNVRNNLFANLLAFQKQKLGVAPSRLSTSLLLHDAVQLERDDVYDSNKAALQKQIEKQHGKHTFTLYSEQDTLKNIANVFMETHSKISHMLQHRSMQEQLTDSRAKFILTGMVSPIIEMVPPILAELTMNTVLPMAVSDIKQKLPKLFMDYMWPVEEHPKQRDIILDMAPATVTLPDNKVTHALPYDGMKTFHHTGEDEPEEPPGTAFYDILMGMKSNLASRMINAFLSETIDNSANLMHNSQSHNIYKHTWRQINLRLSVAVSTGVTQSLIPAVANGCFLVLAKSIHLKAAKRLTKLFTRTLTSSISQSVTKGLTRAPVADMFCELCRNGNEQYDQAEAHTKEFCTACLSAETEAAHIDYYTAHYADYYGRYFDYYYADYYTDDFVAEYTP